MSYYNQYKISYPMKYPIRELSLNQVEDLIRLKYGDLVKSTNNKSYVSNTRLSKIFGISETKVR